MPRILLLVLLVALPASVAAQGNLVVASASFRDCEICPEMVMIPAGSFMMGTPDSEPGSYIWERPQRQIPISHAFAAGKYEVTFDEWDACVRERGCSYKPGDQGWGRGRRPVINVAWSDAKEYVAWLSRKTSKAYRLLSEAEWEYAARAGTATIFSFGSTISAQHANYDASHSYAGSPTGVAEGKTVEVGKYAPNAFGLYDVHGNVWEWVEDCYGEYAGAPKDGRARTSGACASRPVRGGSWISPPRDLRSATRNSSVPNRRSSYLGLRVAKD